MEITAYRLYQVQGYYEVLSLSPLSNGIAPDKINITLSDEFQLVEGRGGDYILHTPSGGICRFAVRSPGAQPMLAWEEQDEKGNLKTKTRILKAK